VPGAEPARDPKNKHSDTFPYLPTYILSSQRDKNVSVYPYSQAVYPSGVLYYLDSVWPYDHSTDASHYDYLQTRHQRQCYSRAIRSDNIYHVTYLYYGFRVSRITCSGRDFLSSCCCKIVPFRLLKSSSLFVPFSCPRVAEVIKIRRITYTSMWTHFLERDRDIRELFSWLNEKTCCGVRLGVR